MIFFTGSRFDPTGDIHSVRSNLGYCIADVLREEAASEDDGSAKSGGLDREVPIKFRACAAELAGDVAIKEKGGSAKIAKGRERGLVLDAESLDDFQTFGRKILAIGGILRAVQLDGVDADTVGDFEERADGFIYEYADLGDERWKLGDDARGGSRGDVARTAGEENETESVSASIDSDASVFEICQATDLNANRHGGGNVGWERGSVNAGNGPERGRSGAEKGRPSNPIEKRATQ